MPGIRLTAAVLATLRVSALLAAGQTRNPIEPAFGPIASRFGLPAAIVAQIAPPFLPRTPLVPAAPTRRSPIAANAIFAGRPAASGSLPSLAPRPAQAATVFPDPFFRQYIARQMNWLTFKECRRTAWAHD
jgi:hypothetical protein